MSAFKDPGFAERRTTAATAKRAALQNFREASPANDPEFAGRQAAKAVARASLDARAVERKSARAAQVEIEKTAREAEIQEQAARELASKAEQKASRDARYAARKARKR